MHERPRRARPPYESGKNDEWQRSPEESARAGDRSGMSWPPRIPEPGDDLPPSARWYGMPVPPPPRRTGDGLRRLLFASLALAVCGGILSGLVVLVLRVLPSSSSPPGQMSDTAAGVSYPLPDGWLAGSVPPVTAFTSVVGNGGSATVMVRPGEQVADVRKATVELSEVYARLLLHGDEVEVLEDQPITVGGRTGHSRSLRAVYRDVVNRPSYLNVVFLTGSGGRPVVVVAVAQPDSLTLRAEIDLLIMGIH
ncbi:hypothetical protein [Streptosporangium lutulentum]|uniref:DUF1795 domain-containing protein n=1 Tax=Streptosporangium lutulentum TaxID=1461250 RepID=A0ABT9QHA5_9ACTN|nr:hypothetical protein [Streptosporangium lutulentum]MDP9846136.1 hypothetical protein [Streptosporangium lutulentum]